MTSLGQLCRRLLALACATAALHAQAQLQVLATTAPVKIWISGAGDYRGYRTSGELLAAQNANHQYTFDRCMARAAALPPNTPWGCSLLTMTGIRPADPPFPQIYNGEHWYFYVNAYWTDVGWNGQPYTITREANDNYGVYSNLVCATQHQFGANTVTLSPNNYQVTCIRWVKPPITCPCPGSAGSGAAGSAPGAWAGPPGKTAQGAAPGTAGNPISILDGTKTETRTDFVDPRRLLSYTREFAGQWDEAWRMPGSTMVTGSFSPGASAGSIVETYRGATLDTEGRSIPYVVDLQFPYIRNSPNGEIFVHGSAGAFQTFTASATGTFATEPSGDSVEVLATPTAEGATLRIRRANDVVDEFGPDGRQRRRQMRDGPYVVFGYQGGALTELRDNWGRRLSITAGEGGRPASLTLPTGQVISYAFEGKLLNTVTYEDGTQTRYLYNETAYIGAGGQPAPYALTGTIDEAGERVGTYRYDAYGTALSTEGAGGVDKFGVATFAGSYSTVTSPTNAVTTIAFTPVRGTLAVSRRTQPVRR